MDGTSPLQPTAEMFSTPEQVLIHYMDGTSLDSESNKMVRLGSVLIHYMDGTSHDKRS